MADPMTSDIALEKATQAQRLAADPSGTRLAAANAGSGKTRVLVDRVSRILLGGTKPEDIMCLTYTKAAASEMQERLFRKLGGWSVLGDDLLNDALTELFGQAPETLNPPVIFSQARELFAKALETPEGLKVQTIHAFCERILSRFPIEAGILPGFEPLDEVEIAELRREVETQILTEGMENPDGDIARSLQVLTLARADESLKDLFKWMALNPQKIAAWETRGLEGLAQSLSLRNLRNATEIADALWSRLNRNSMQAASEALKNGGKNDVKRGDLMADALIAADSVSGLGILSGLYLTQKNQPRAKYYDAKTESIAKVWIDDHASDVIQASEKLRASHIYALTEAVFNLSIRYAALYREAKHRARGLDFSDQILFVRRLLQNTEAADWVRYKLDGGIKHILLDEAQDTSPEQWEIINILADPFFQPSPDEDKNSPRTLFAVGDEKQSIYGFQGAKPERFLEEIRRRSEQATTDIRMTMSFRSTQQILDIVDAVLFDCDGMQSMFDAETFPPASDETRHIAHRTDKGLVELWPITPPPEKVEDKEAWDTTPVNALAQGHQIEVLAKKIAETVKGWIDNKDPIFDRAMGKTRPIKPQDVLILVRRRNDLFDAIIRHLKLAEVPIAGADRLKLSEAIIVKDLLALSRFCLLPKDDFSLAETLKSPIFGYDDEALMKVAIDRKGSLLGAVKLKEPETYKVLQRFIYFSKTLTPYDFYARILDARDGTGQSIRQRFYRRLSMEARDALEAFLHQALEHQSRAAPNLQTFLAAFAKGDVEIKREQDASFTDVRVMTVHGAKGLEAPIVILPDTTNIPSKLDSVIPDNIGGFIWSSGDVPHLEAAKTAAKTAISREQLRLLYVAMTRAESRLIICGPHVGKATAKLKEGCWYDWVKRGMEALGAQPYEAPFSADTQKGLRYGEMAIPAAAYSKDDAKTGSDLPDWINMPAPQEGPRRHRVTPSHLLTDPPQEMPVRSPAQSGDPNVFLRGNLIHKLLELLPDVDPDVRQDTARKLLDSYSDVTETLANQILEEVFSVLDHPEFSHLFASGSQAEVSLAGSAKGLPKGLYLNAQIDRLCVTDKDVIIVDYKSNRPPPTDPENVSDLYLGQMAAYRELAREIYPDHEVSCALLWTDGPHLMRLPEALLDAALQKVAALPIS